LPAVLDAWFGLATGLAALAGAIVLLAGKRKGRHAGDLPLLWLGVPILLAYAASFKEPLFSPRYFIVVVPAFILLVAGAMARLPLAAGALGLTLLAAGSLWAVERGNTVPGYAKEDYRLAGTYIGARTDPGDRVLLIANYIFYPFHYYFHGQGTVMPLTVTPRTRLTPLLTPIAEQSDHVWLVEAHDVFVDPKNRVAAWFRSRYPVADEKYITGIHFIEFDPHPTLAALPAGATPMAIRFQSGPELAGYEVHPGEPLGVTLYWRAPTALAVNDHISLKLWAADGTLGGQRDGEPLNAGLPFTRLPVGPLVRDEHFVAARPGSYHLFLTLYPPSRPGSPLRTASGQTRVPLGKVSLP
ncbi:MAG: hypothetical protein ACYDAG_19310, partial [Chloroflexota bacterium]